MEKPKIATTNASNNSSNYLKQLIGSVKSLRAAKVTTELTTSRLQQQIEQSHLQLAASFLDIHELMSLLKEVGPNTPESKYLVMLQQKRTEKLPPSLNQVCYCLIGSDHDDFFVE